ELLAIRRGEAHDPLRRARRELLPHDRRVAAEGPHHLPGGYTVRTHRCTPSDVSPSEGGDPGEGPADDQLLDLAGSLVQGRNPGVPQVLPGGVLVDVAVAAVRLHAGVRGADRGLGREQLRLRRRERVLLTA